MPVTPLTGTCSVAFRKNFEKKLQRQPALAGLAQTMINIRTTVMQVGPGMKFNLKPSAGRWLVVAFGAEDEKKAHTYGNA